MRPHSCPEKLNKKFYYIYKYIYINIIDHFHTYYACPFFIEIIDIIEIESEARRKYARIHFSAKLRMAMFVISNVENEVRPM